MNCPVCSRALAEHEGGRQCPINFDTLVSPAGFAPQAWQSKAPTDAWGNKGAVGYSEDVARVLQLGRRIPELDGTERAQAIIDVMTERFARPIHRNCKCATIDPDRHREEGCITRLRLVQAITLREIAICGGALGAVGTGHGKTLIDLLAPLAYGAVGIRKCLLLVPPKLVQQLQLDYEYYGQHFKMPQIVVHGTDFVNTCTRMMDTVHLDRDAPELHVMSYTKISLKESTDWLEKVLKPQAILADECFPGETLVITDEGSLPIAEIVENGRGRRALSFNTETSAYVWRDITKRLKRDGQKRLVRVEHEHGSFVCTEDHKIWTADGDYVPARSLTTGRTLVRAPLPEVREELLHKKQRKDNGTLLLSIVRCQPRAEGQEVAEEIGGEESEAEWDRCGLARATRDLECSEARKDLPGAGREREADEAATMSACGARSTRGRNGARDTDTRSARALPELAGQLQGRPGVPGCEISDRDRRQNTSDQEVEVSRQAQDGDSRLSRVVGVAFLEQGNARGNGSSCSGDPVYDLTVEGEHNYFADGILVSNCHKLRNITTTATGSRVARYMDQNRGTRFVGLSGSLTSKKLQDMTHLAGWALRGGSPLPLDPETSADLARAVNPSDEPADPGPWLGVCAPGESFRDGFSRRIIETLGFISTSTSSIDTPLRIDERPAPPIPESIVHALKMGRGLLPEQQGEGGGPQRPDGEELVDAFAIQRNALQLACGFYYRWIFPRCTFPRDIPLVEDWRMKRGALMREIRDKLKARDEHLDSELLCRYAAERYHGLRDKHKGLPLWNSRHLLPWYEVKDKVYYETETVWLSDFLVDDAIAWAREAPGVIWYQHGAFGERVERKSMLQGGAHIPLFGAGEDAKERLLGNHEKGYRGEDGSRSVLLALKALGTGTNGLQHRFGRALIANPSSSAEGWEQPIARLHRPGQNRPAVDTYFYMHTDEMRKIVSDALKAAFYVQGILRNPQKIVMSLRLE